MYIYIIIIMPKKAIKYVEKIQSDKTDSKIKKDIIKLNIAHFHVNDHYTADSINEYKRNFVLLNQNQNPIMNQYLPFFYLNKNQINNIRDNDVRNEINSYINKIKDDFSYALGFPYKQQFLRDTIEAIDRPKETDDINNLPRGKKLNRLRKFHKNIIEFTLKTLHDFYWISIKRNKKNTQTLDFYIQMIIPIILDLVDKFEAEIEKEYPADLIEKQMAIEYKKA